MSRTDSFGGTTVEAQLDCITDVIATPTSMYSASAGIRKVLCGVQHDVESPAGRYAVSLAQGWLRSGEPHSVNGIVDGFSIVQCLPFGAWTWGAGGAVNPCSVQWEQAGYVTFTREMWLGIEKTDGTATYERPDGTRVVWTALMNQQMAAQFVNFATMVAQTNQYFHWGVPRFGTQDEFNQMLNGVEVGVWFAHNDVSNWDPQHRTSHTDHSPNYPRAEHMALAGRIFLGNSPIIPPAPTPPAPTPPAPEDDMYGDDDRARDVKAAAAVAAVKAELDALKGEVDTILKSTSYIGALVDWIIGPIPAKGKPRDTTRGIGGRVLALVNSKAGAKR